MTLCVCMYVQRGIYNMEWRKKCSYRCSIMHIVVVCGSSRHINNNNTCVRCYSPLYLFIVFLVLKWAYISTLNALFYCFPPRIRWSHRVWNFTFFARYLPVKPQIVHKYVHNSAWHHIISFSFIPSRIGIIFMRKPWGDFSTD